jgi:hypothetical protein
MRSAAGAPMRRTAWLVGESVITLVSPVSLRLFVAAAMITDKLN